MKTPLVAGQQRVYLKYVNNPLKSLFYLFYPGRIDWRTQLRWDKLKQADRWLASHLRSVSRIEPGVGRWEGVGR